MPAFLSSIKGLKLLDISNMPVLAKLILNVSSAAHQVNQLCEPYLIAPPNGVYITNKLEPVMVDRNNYFVNYHGQRTIADITKDSGTIHGEMGNVVIPGVYLRQKERHVSNCPTLPYYGIKIIRKLVDDQLEHARRYHQNRTNHKSDIFCYFKADDTLTPDIANEQNEYAKRMKIHALHSVLLERVEHITSEIYNQIDSFIGEDGWNIHIATMHDYTLTVCKYMDFRILDWMRIQQEKEEAKTQNYTDEWASPTAWR